MAQLRQDHKRIMSLETRIIVVGPDNRKAFEKYFLENELPFIGLPDPKHTILKLFGQQVNLFKLGRMPAQVIIDKQGVARYAHYGHAMSDIPDNEDIMRILQAINSTDTTSK